MPKIDYTWAIVLGVIVILAISWTALSKTFGNFMEKAENKEMYERGERIFNDPEIWAGPDYYRSCATCHAEGFVAPEGKEIEMVDYKKSQPHILKNLKRKYGSNLLSSDDPLYEQFIKCLTNPNRMACGPVSRNAKHVQDLLFYLRKQ